MNATLQAEIMRVINAGIARHPRTLQKMIGPSEIGDPCDRAIIAKLTGTYPADLAPAWKPAIGTAMHAQLETWFTTETNPAPDGGGGGARWLTETPVRVGTLTTTTPDGDTIEQPINGTSDLFHPFTGTVIDWKIVGPAHLKQAAANGPGDTYRAQAHLYGLGFENAGYRVTTVMDVFLPRNGELQQTVFWTEPYDRQLALNALNRLDRLNRLAVNVGADVALALYPPCAQPFCRICRASKLANKAAQRLNVFA